MTSNQNPNTRLCADCGHMRNSITGERVCLEHDIKEVVVGPGPALAHPQKASMNVVGFAGFSNSGKTTLVERLIPLMRAQGLRVSVEPDGRFEITLSCRRQPGNWLPMEPDTSMLIVRQTFDYHNEHPEFVRIVMNENIHRAEYLQRSTTIRQLNVKAIDSIRGVYDRGVAQGVFRPGLDPVDIHAAISALTVFNVSNRYTFGTIFNRDDFS